MPFIAEHEGDLVWPDEVETGEGVTCPECNKELRPRSAYKRENGSFVPRHFFHLAEKREGSPSSCGGVGESDRHKWMKYIALQKLRVEYEHEEAGREVAIGDKWADTAVLFEEPRHPFGYGILAEAQYRNKGKAVDETTQYYLERGYSVVWLEEEHYDDTGKGDVDLKAGDWYCPWPDAVPEHTNWMTSEWLADIESSPSELPIYNQETGCLTTFEAGLWTLEEDVRFPPEIKPSVRLLLTRCWLAGQEKAENYASELPPVEEWGKDGPYGSGPLTTTDIRVDLGLETSNQAETSPIAAVWDVNQTDAKSAEDFETPLPVPFPTEISASTQEVIWEVWEAALPDKVPEVSEWGKNARERAGLPEEQFLLGRDAIAEVRPQDPRVELVVDFPAELPYAFEKTLKAAHKFSQGENYDVSRALTENAADRSCAECGDSADYYLLHSERGVSGFYCFDCIVDNELPAPEEGEPADLTKS